VRDLTKIITLPNNNFDAIDEKVRGDSVLAWIRLAEWFGIITAGV
jgi:hypothetical protein